MVDLSDIAVVIPVRMHSSRIERKVMLSLKDEEGKEYNLLEWKLNQLIKVLSPSQIFISTESEIFKNIAISYGCNVLSRSEYLTKQNYVATTREQVEGVIKDVKFKHIAWITAVVPLMQPKEYLESFIQYKKNVESKSEYDSLVTVNLLKEYFWDDNGPINYEANENHPASQLLPNMYRVTNGLYMAPKSVMMNRGYFLGANPYKQIVSKISGIDIDEYEDYEMTVDMLNTYFKRIRNESIIDTNN